MVKNLSTIDRSTKVRLGRHATDDQADNTIVINASNAPISAQTPGSLYMTPVRKVPGGNTKIVGYDNITNEIVDTDIDEQAIIPRVVDFYANIGNTFTSTIVFEGENSLITTGNVGISNTEPIHTLDVGSNLWVDDTGSTVLNVTGGVHIDGNLDVEGQLTVIESQNLRISDAIIEVGKGNTTADVGMMFDHQGSNVVVGYKDDELIMAHTQSSADQTSFTANTANPIKAHVYGYLVTQSNVGVINTNPIHTLDVGSNLYVDDVASNVLYVKGATDLDGNLIVYENAYIEQDLRIKENAYVTQDLTVTENVLVSNNLTVTKDLTVNDNAYVTQDLTVTENVLVSNNLTVTKDLEVTENVLVSNNLTVTKDVEVVENVLVSNNLTVTKDLTVNDNAYVTQDLTVTENVLVSNNLTVTKNSYVTKDLTVTENVFVSNNLTVTKDTTTQDIKVTTLSAGRVPFVDDNKYLVDSANFIYDTSNNKLTVTGDIVTTGNMFIQGETTYVSTENLVVNDAIIGIANNNTSDTLDMGIIMQRPSSNVVIGYRGDESEIIMAHTLDGFSNIEITPDTSNLIDVHVYGRLKTDTNVDVGSNIYITDTGSAGLINVIGNVTATTFNGDGGLLSNIDLQVVSDKGNSTTQTVQFTNPTTAFTTDLTSNVQLKLDQLSNVNLESLSEDQLLVYDGANWVNDYNVHNFVKIKNNTGADLLKGQAVYVKDGWNANVSNVALAQSDSSDTMPSIGVMHDTVANGGEGVAVAYGKVQNIDTSNFEVGQTVYVSNTVPGGLMGTKPYGLTDQIQNVGICLIKSTQQKPNKGTIFVTGVGRSNDIPNAQIVQNETAINYVYVNDTNNDLKKIVPSNLLTQLQTLQQVTDTSNTTSNTIRFTNATTGFETTSNAVIGSNISITGLTQKFIPFVGDGNFLQDSSIKKDNGNIIITADTEITGNLLVNGNTYTISSSELIIDDRIIAIANNNPSHNYDEGIIMFHPGHNVALIHHGDEDRFSMGYTQNTVNATHVLPDDGNTFALDVLGTISTQNSITVRGGGSYFGDGGTLSNVTLERVITLNNTADSTVIFDNKTAAFVTNVYSNTGIANLNPIHMLDVGANVYVEDGAAGGTINVIGNVTATSFIGDGGLLSNLATNFDEIIINGNTTTGTAIFDNTTAALVTNVYSNTGIANLNPIHMLDVGDNIYMDSVSINVTGNVAATRFIGDGGLLSNLATNFDQIIINGNTTTGTVIFDNTTVALVTNVYSNTGIANLNPIHMLDVGANVYIEDGTINVIGNVTATTFIGDGGLLSNLATNFDEIIINGNTTTGTAIFDNTTAALVTNVYSNTGIANLNPIHMLDVGDNIYMDSTSMNVTGNVVATRFIGDGSFLDNIASTLEQIIINGNTTSNTVIFDNTMASFVTNVYSNTGIANLNPIHTLDIGSNVWFTDTENYKLNINGNAIMKNITLDSITLGTVFPLQAVTRTGNTTSNTVEFKNDTTGLVTTSNAGIANINVVHTLDVGANLYVEDTGSNVLYVRGNTYSEIVTTGALGVNNIAAQHDLSIGSNLWVEDTGSNVLTITGNVLANKLTLGSIELIPSYTLDNVIDVSNVASNTVEFNDATTAFVTASNVGIGTTDPRTLLEVQGGLITNSDSYACKRYSYSNVSIPANFSNVALVFASNVFCAKITAQLLHGNEEVSTMVLNAQGGTRNGSTSSLDIATSSMTLFGHTNGYPWSPTMAVTPTKIIMEPSGVGTATFGCDIFVEYTSSAPDGKLESISIGDDTVKSFVY